jgi:putative addiction module killer protein
MSVSEKRLLLYCAESGRVPFEEWFLALKDRKARAVVRVRLTRLEQGNAGEFEPVGNGVYELKIRFGPGYRVYFGEDEKTL